MTHVADREHPTRLSHQQFSLPHALAASLVVVSALLLSPGDVTAQISGLVFDQNVQPIEGARVGVQASNEWTLTLADGSYSIADATGSVTVVAAKKGHYNESIAVTAPSATANLFLFFVPAEDDPAYTFVDPDDCGSCHPDQLSQWTGSPMAKAGTNTWVHDIYSGTGTPGGMGGFVYLNDSVFAGHNPESECASCHQPESWMDDPFSAMVGIPSSDPKVLHGVSCDICHKIADIDETKLNFPGLFPGHVTVTRPDTSTSHQVQYGLLGDTDFEAIGSMRASYQPQLASEVCAACHQDKNDPDEDGDFEEANGVISEPTYFEWDVSPYADPESPYYATCVDCHMMPSGEIEACNALDPPLLRDPSTLRSHRIEGTTPYYLENAADLALDAYLVGSTLHVEATVTNSLTGHHVPTGVTVRNMILLVEAERVEDATELTHTGTQVVHDLGGIGDPAQGYYAGEAGKFYSKVNEDAMGNGPTFFTDAVTINFDNRIPALASDPTSYTFAVPPGDGTLLVEARLIYRRAFRFLVDAKGWTEDGHGNPLADVAPPHYGHLMESASRTVLAVSCAGQPLGASCSDGNPCNGSETCDGVGNCNAGVALVCDDANGCTTDVCDPVAGCQYTNNTDPCSDGDACTTGDACASGSCVSGAALDCNDGNPCTDLTCDSGIGCTYPPIPGPCSDGDACTLGDTCAAGVCQPGTGPDCDDGDPCTTDTCDSNGGCMNTAEPPAGCFVADGASIDVRDRDQDSKDRIKLSWRGATPAADVGTPWTTTNYALCVYDTSGEEPSVAATLRLPAGASWEDRGAGSIRYKDSAVSPDGVKVFDLAPRANGTSRMKFVASGANTPTPTPVTPLLMFEQDPGLVTALINDETSSCWTTTFPRAGNRRHKVDRFKSRAP